MVFLLAAFLILAILFEKWQEKRQYESWKAHDHFMQEEREKYFLYDKDGNLKKGI